MNKLAGNISDSVLAAVGVCNKIAMFPFGIILGFAQGFQPVAGFNWGAKRYDRVQESYRFSSKVALLGGVIMAVVLILFADPLIVLFAGADEEMRHLVVICMVPQRWSHSIKTMARMCKTAEVSSKRDVRFMHRSP